MAFNFGTVTQYDDVNSIMTPEVLITAKSIKLGANEGRLFQMLAARQTPIQTVEFEIFNRTQTTKAGSLTAGIDDTVVVIPVDAASIKGLTVGSVMQIENELVVVKSVDQAANEVTVWKRGAGESTAAAHASGVAYKVIGTAINDTDLKDLEGFTESTNKYTNYCQTFAEVLDYTKRADELARRGLTPTQIMLVLREEQMIKIARDISMTAVLGQKQAGVRGSSPYMTAGIFAQLADNAAGGRPVLSLDASGAALTEDILRAALAPVFDQGIPNSIWVSSKNKEIINGFNNASSSNIVLNKDAMNTVAGVSVNAYNYDNNILNVYVDSAIPDNKIAILDMSKATKGWMVNDVLRIEEEPSRSSREKRESVQGSLGIALEDVGYAHTYIDNLG